MVLNNFCQGDGWGGLPLYPLISKKFSSKVWLGCWSADWAPDVNWFSLPGLQGGKEIPKLGPLQSRPAKSHKNVSKGHMRCWQGR